MLAVDFSLTLAVGGLCALAYALLSAFAAVNGAFLRPAELPLRLLGLLAIVSAVWSLAVVIADQSDYEGPTHVAALIDTLRYGVMLALVISLMARRGGADPTAEAMTEVALATKPANPSRLTELRAALATPLGLATRLVLGVTLLLRLVALADPFQSLGNTHWLMMCGLALPVMGLILIEQLVRNATQRWSIKPLCLGLGALCGFDIYLYAEAALLGTLDADVNAIRPLAHAFAVPLFWLALRRSATWQRRVHISHRAVFYSAALLLIGTYLLFIAAVGYYVRYAGGDWGRALQQGLAVASVIVLALLIASASLRARVRVFIGKHFFSYRYDYREEWLAFTDLLGSANNPQQTGEHAIRALANIVECPAGSLWLREPGGAHFRQTARWNAHSCAETVPEDAPLVGFLKDSGWVIDLGEYRRDPRQYQSTPLPPWLVDDPHYWALIPMPLPGGGLLGWIALAPARTAIELDWETRDLLKAASRQAASYLAQMQATEALLEARKFDAFNRMSAFVVHDLKNIVAQLSLMTKNAQRLRDNPEFQDDMLLTVDSSLEKMRRLMLQLREGATPPDGSRGVELTPIAQRLQQLARSVGRSLQVQIDAPLATRGHEERLERVLGHLVQNSLDATTPQGRVWLSVGRFSGQVRVEVGDEGCGMTEDFIRERLFRPFSSTKQSGMGIGSYESAQYIREIGGAIDVRSTPGKGTVMTVLLPLFDVRRGSDLQAPAAR
jgi:putative PEP-CTERM system histidine kinase